jgi:hypothetical protein
MNLYTNAFYPWKREQENDVKGAQNYGIDSIFYDFNNAHPEYKGRKIIDLLDILDLE